MTAHGWRNRARVTVETQLLALLRDHHRLSRSDLARRLDLPKTTVAAVVSDLLADGIVVEEPARSGGPSSGAGRPARALTLARPDGIVAGLDFGHRHVRVALGDGGGSLIRETTVDLDVDHRPVDALDTAADLLTGLLADVGAHAGDLRAAAVGIPGPIDAATRRVHSPTILSSWVGLDLHGELRARTGVEVLIDNDANYGALGELRHGAARGHRDFVYVKASNGIGACLMLNGVPYRGSGGIAGEIGHTQLDPDGEWCRCGNRGCLEATVSIDVIRRQLRPLGLDPLDADAADHPVARKILAESGRTVGRVLANLCNALNPSLIIVGGDLVETGDAFINGIRQSIERLALPSPDGTAPVLPAQLGRRAEVSGALTSAADNLADRSIPTRHSPH